MAKTYTKIPGLGTGRGGLQIAVRTRMYRGPDHLLIVQSTGYAEEYKRIFFRDIRYVEVRKTQTQLIHAIVSGVLTFLLALLYFVHLPWGFVIAFCFPFALWFVANLVWGPSCQCYVSTNVQMLPIPTPRRRRKIATLINFLRAQTAAFDSAEAPQPA